jgi:signal transduction histidine kinase
MPSLSPRNWRLATRLTVGVVGLLVLLQLIVLATYAANLQERREAALDNAVDVGRTLAAVVDGFTRDLEGMTLAAALAYGASAGPLDQPTVGPSLARTMSEYGVLRALFFTDLSGRVIASDSGVGVGVDLSSRPYITALRQGAQAAWSDGLSGLESGETTVAFARVVPAPDGTPRGYLVAAFHPERMIERLPGGLPGDATFVLTDRRGFRLYSSEARPAEQSDLSNVPEVGAALAGRIGRFADAALPSPGEARYGAFIPVQHVGWVVGFARPQARLDAQLRDRFLRQGGAITLVMLLAVTATAVFAHRLAAPLAVLARRAGAIARGERQALPQTMDDADVEVMQLANAMSAMGDAVAERERALRDVAALEQTARTEAEATAARVRAVQSVTDAALAHLRLDELLDELLVRVRETLKVETATILLVDPEAKNLLAAASKGLEEEVEMGIQVPVGQGFAGRVAAEQRPVILHDVEARAVYSPILRQKGLRSLLGVPLLVEGRLIGVLQVGSLEARAFDVDDASLLQLVADRAALAVDHARLYREAQEAITARDEFLSVAAHELRTPMTSVRASAQLLLRQLDREGGPDQARLRQMLEIIEGQSDRLGRLVAQLLDVSRIQSGRLALEFEAVDLVGLVEGVADGVRSTAGGHTIAVRAPDRLDAHVDPLRFEQVVTNLLDNAVKYSPDGQAIDVELSQPASDIAKLTVTDRGDGVPPEYRERIFEPFYQAPSAGRSKGLGLGLYITRQTVELHGGRIELESPPNGGTRFVVTVPIEAARSDGAVGRDGSS